MLVLGKLLDEMEDTVTIATDQHIGTSHVSLGRCKTNV